ncbi:tRNA (guanosine(46)-N7)-methyltransferase TrmB [Thermopetrobacter sp. TC1]|uniref:tRNA (guanosine(46)-N7)-methyltransferase TrmB n=1 Tax=Thermopetrobacter sp. TC1 TaxID=1495045 RepID=UPI001E4D512E|nr:tRNA (guanosine(46)-N7)-methyltransferase TrmB [Thermopetrobacter sp. TC1]
MKRTLPVSELMTDRNRITEPRFFGRRKSRPLKPRQQRLMEELLPALRIAADDDAWMKAPAHLFAPPPEHMALEIGFGGGEHLARLAAQRPDWGFIGCEPFINGVAKLLSQIADAGLDNIRIWDDDARLLLPLLGSEQFDEIYLLYPDPWPKKKHRKRRFVGPETLEDIHRILKPGGRFFFASDIPDYVAWTLEHVRRHGKLMWLAERPEDWRQPWPGWQSTRYEAKALREGRTPAYLIFAKPE